MTILISGWSSSKANFVWQFCYLLPWNWLTISFFDKRTITLIKCQIRLDYPVFSQVQYEAQLIWNINPGFQFEATMRWDNDFVILKLKEPLDFNDDVQPACLPPSNYLQEHSTEDQCFTSGWGHTTHGTVQNSFI